MRKFAGAATTLATVDATCVVTYGDLMRLAIDLDKTPDIQLVGVLAGALLGGAAWSGMRARYRPARARVERWLRRGLSTPSCFTRFARRFAALIGSSV